MNCCNANGVCEQGRDCPIRKQRIKETNESYINRGLEPSHYDDFADTFRALITVIAVIGAFTLLAFLIWGK